MGFVPGVVNEGLALAVDHVGVAGDPHAAAAMVLGVDGEDAGEADNEVVDVNPVLPTGMELMNPHHGSVWTSLRSSASTSCSPMSPLSQVE